MLYGGEIVYGFVRETRGSWLNPCGPLTYTRMKWGRSLAHLSKVVSACEFSYLWPCASFVIVPCTTESLGRVSGRSAGCWTRDVIRWRGYRRDRVTLSPWRRTGPGTEVGFTLRSIWCNPLTECTLVVAWKHEQDAL
jgi:hypothetical protein